MSDHAPAPAAAAEGEAAPASSKAKIPLIAAIVVGLAVGAGTGAAVVGPIVIKKMGITAPAVLPPADAAEHGADAEEGGGEHGAAKEESGGGEHGGKAEGAAVPVVTLENLVLNPASSGGQRYLLMSIAIEASDAKVVADLTARDAELKDLILTTLSKKTVDELSDVTAREPIKAELMASLKERFGKKSIKQLYFPQFVIQ